MTSRSNSAFVYIGESRSCVKFGDKLYEVLHSGMFVDSFTSDRMKEIFYNDRGLPGTHIGLSDLVPEEIYNSPLYQAMREE